MFSGLPKRAHTRAQTHVARKHKHIIHTNKQTNSWTQWTTRTDRCNVEKTHTITSLLSQRTDDVRHFGLFLFWSPRHIVCVCVFAADVLYLCVCILCVYCVRVCVKCVVLWAAGQVGPVEMNNCTRLQGNYTVTIMKRWLFVVVFYLADIDLCVLSRGPIWLRATVFTI